MKKYTIFLVALILAAVLGVSTAAIFAQSVEDKGSTPSSRITLLQTGTIPDSQVGAAVKQYKAYGCALIDVFTIDENHSNVYCLNVLIAETKSPFALITLEP